MLIPYTPGVWSVIYCKVEKRVEIASLFGGYAPPTAIPRKTAWESRLINEVIGFI
jgi:hypothetical protein